MAIKLRDYQQKSVNAVLDHFRESDEPALLVLPTGAGKSHVIAELGRLARGRVMVLAHVKELVEQNHKKYEALGLKGDIYSAGLKRRESSRKVVFGSVQSVARHLDEFDVETSLLIIDECHRISDDENSQYHQVFNHLKEINPKLKILGLTATPYRLGMGWIFEYHTRGRVHSEERRFFKKCVYELPLRYLIRKKYLTPPRVMSALAAQYHFGDITPGPTGRYKESDVTEVLEESKRATPKIIEQVVELAQERKGIMIFAATVPHAREIMGYLPEEEAALILGETPQIERDALIQSFKEQKLKYLVNVAVLTTGFDAPHVDLIAILRPTESVSLFQQIVGRGLRLAPDKEECLILDYADNGYDIYAPEVGTHRPDRDSEQVQVVCPTCGFGNIFWGKMDENGVIIEHYGRRCQGFEEFDGQRVRCDYRFRFKLCDHCGAPNDIAARQCNQCDKPMVDADKRLREALGMKHAKVIRCAGMVMQSHKTKKGATSLKITYHDEDGAELEEYFRLDTDSQNRAFQEHFVRLHHKAPGEIFKAKDIAEVLAQQDVFRAPDFVVAYKEGRFWSIRDKLFDYEGRYRKANEEH